jgi:signal recognition particle subunit SRP72
MDSSVAGPSEQQKVTCAPLFNDLQKYLSIKDYRQALKITNKILHSDGFRDSYKIQKCKASALLKMSRYDEVVKFINSLSSAEQKSRLAYESSYSLYRQFKNAEALTAISTATINNPDDKLKIDELRAQILYRLEDFQEARDIYKQLLRETSDDLEEDRETNLLACEASIAIRNHTTGHAKKLKISKVNAVNPEAYFNRSIVHVGNADLKKAEKSCQNAKNEYEAFDDLEQDELEQELAPIQAQLGLIYQLQGEKGKSLSMYQKVLNTQPDLILTSIINNNIIASNQEANLFESKRKAKALQTKNQDLIRKLQKTQLVTMDLNRALVSYQSNQFQQALDIIAEIDPAQIPKNLHDVQVVKAACLAKLGKVDEATSLLKTKIAGVEDSERKVDQVEKLNLAIAQLDLGSADVAQYKTSPAFVALSLAKSESAEDRVEIMKLAEGVWKEENEMRKKLLEQYGAALLKIGDEKTACDVYEELSSKNDEFLPKFIEVASRVDPSKGKAAAARLPSAEILTDNIDVEELEKMSGVAGYAKKKLVEEAEESSEVKKTKTKRKRKPKLPKNLTKTMDDERWVPLRDRSYYKGSKRQRNKRTGKFTGDQGGTDKKTEAKFDYSNKPAASPAPAQSSGGKKKGKGGKKRK